jgi:propionyl-CoA carboxylase alpha chain
VDTGVYEGGEIPMFYDSMIAKLIVHAPDREAAIMRMREALNAFVIRGISSNVPFQSALLSHPRFVAGDFNTGFIAENYPKGFSSAQVPHPDPDFVLALSAAAHRLYRERAAGISGQLQGHGYRVGEDFMLVIKGERGQHTYKRVTMRFHNALSVRVEGKRYELAKAWRFGGIRALGSCNGKPFTAQVEREGVWVKATHNGLTLETIMLSTRGAELAKLMPFKPPPDTSKLLLSPMPGLLADIFVERGQPVQAGERLAVIEAMKMENVLTAAQDGTVAELLARKGASLAVDEPIMRFE